MANNWNAINQLFQIEAERTGVSAKEWCEQNGYNYQSARRYLKTRAQSATTSKTSRTAAQSSTKNPKKNAQTAQKSLRKSNAQNNSAQSSLPNESMAETENSVELASDSEAGSTGNGKPKGRDEQGRFVRGEYEGNPNPSNLFEPGNQVAFKHGGYATLLKEQDLEIADESEVIGLMAERRLCRARIASALRTIQETEDALAEPGGKDDPENVLASIRLINSANDAINAAIARVESLTRTLSAIRIDDVNVPRLAADKIKIEAQTAKLRAETDKLGRKSTAESVVYQLDW